MASVCLNVQDIFFSIHAGRLWHVEHRAASHRNRNDPLIQCDSLCCSSALGRNCWIRHFPVDGHFLETLFVFVVTAVCSAVCVCLLLPKLLSPDVVTGYHILIFLTLVALIKTNMAKRTRPRSGVCKERCAWLGCALSTVPWAADSHLWWMYVSTCLLASFFTVGSAVLRRTRCTLTLRLNTLCVPVPTDMYVHSCGLHTCNSYCFKLSVTLSL